MKKRTIRYLLKRIRKQLKANYVDINITWLTGNRSGTILSWSEGVIIQVNPFDEIVSTIIHELLHDFYDSKGITEKKVEELEKKIYKSMTLRQKEYLWSLIKMNIVDRKEWKRLEKKELICSCCKKRLRR